MTFKLSKVKIIFNFFNVYVALSPIVHIHLNIYPVCEQGKNNRMTQLCNLFMEPPSMKDKILHKTIDVRNIMLK